MKTEIKMFLREFEPEIRAVGEFLMLVFAVTMALAVVFLSGCYDGADYPGVAADEPAVADTDDESDPLDDDDDLDPPERECVELECPIPELPEPDLSRCWLAQRIFFTVLPGENRIGWPDWECLRSDIEIAECWLHYSTAKPDSVGYRCEFECGLWREVEIEWPAPYGITEVALHNPCLIDDELPLSDALPLPDSDEPVRFDHSSFRKALTQ